MSTSEDEIEILTGCDVVHPDRRGGQHVAMKCTGVRAMDHRSGIAVTVTSERSQHANKTRALAMLAKLTEPDKDETTLLKEIERVEAMRKDAALWVIDLREGISNLLDAMAGQGCTTWDRALDRACMLAGRYCEPWTSLKNPRGEDKP